MTDFHDLGTSSAYIALHVPRSWTTRYQQENQRLADLEVRQQMIGQGFYAIARRSDIAYQPVY